MIARGDSSGPPEAAARELRFAAVLTWALAAEALVQLVWQSYSSGVLQISLRWQATLLLGTVFVVAGGILLQSTRGRPPGRAFLVGSAWIDRLTRRRVLSLALAFVVATVYPAAVYGFAARYLVALFPRLLLFWLATLAMAVLLRGWFPGTPWRYRQLGIMLVYALLLRALMFVPELSAYPFSLGWSEASRYYYASLFRGEALYGEQVAPPELHPTRYLLQAIPFFITDLPLWFHRLWQVVLWWLMPVATAALLVVRHRLSGRWLRLLVGAWIVLYLFQGPVYYHLLVPVVRILVGLDARRPWRSTLFVVAASVWAGLSRLNWYPVPGLLAASLVLVESAPRPNDGPKDLRWPLAWVALGTAAALVAQAAYVRLTGLPADRFTSSLTSELLFYRLWPSATYAWGVLPAAVIASAPLLVSLWWSRPAWLSRLSRWRQAFLAAGLLLLAGGGVLVSVKIGGGSNLHNLDAFLVLLLLIGSTLLLQAGAGETQPRLPPLRQTALIAAAPLVFAVAAGGAWVGRDSTSAEVSLRLLRQAVEGAGQRGERVLFISQRHLLTFGRIEDVDLEPEFETVFLMEMAMSGNRPYLDRFHALLREQAFDLIVVDRLSTTFQGRSHNFGEENDAWVREVSLPILCYYEVSQRLGRPPLDVMVPRTEPACPS